MGNGQGRDPGHHLADSQPVNGSIDKMMAGAGQGKTSLFNFSNNQYFIIYQIVKHSDHDRYYCAIIDHHPFTVGASL
ncbi:hypothetical protein ACTXOX_25000, partial [Pseudomonas helleri]|uniref:hypothetical protein n=1 Tax=Pseudomonas helleri TaxID=1608996 RepID=UPI003FD54F2F